MSMLERQLGLLVDGARQIGMPLDDAQTGQFAAFLKELTLFNPTMKLVGAEGEELVVKHLLDSLTGAPELQRLASERHWIAPAACDVGSGAGFPGIPLALALPHFRFTLVERSGRRCGFLRNACAVCNLFDRVKVLEMDVSAVKQQFDCVVLRAVHPLQTMIDELSAITAPGGLICAYKGRREALDEELYVLGTLHAAKGTDAGSAWGSTIIPLNVPFLEAPRHLWVLERRCMEYTR